MSNRRFRYFFIISVIVGALLVSYGFYAIQHQGETTRAVICENITRTDIQTLANLKTKVDRELIKSLHISKNQLHILIDKQLQVSAQARQSLQPSDPKNACSSAITKLPLISTAKR